MTSQHFVLELKIEKVTTRTTANTANVRRTPENVIERKVTAEMTKVTLRASSYEGILLKAEKLLQLERDLGEDGQLKDASPHTDDLEEDED